MGRSMCSQSGEAGTTRESKWNLWLLDNVDFHEHDTGADAVGAAAMDGVATGGAA